MKRLIVVLLVVLLLFTFSLYFVASAEQNNYCDPIPQDLIPMIEGVPQDCIVFDAPDGTVHAYIIEEYGSGLDGYRLNKGHWEMVIGSNDVLNRRDDARFVRHQANQLRPDGTAYGDAHGFDPLVSCRSNSIPFVFQINKVFADCTGIPVLKRNFIVPNFVCITDEGQKLIDTLLVGLYSTTA